MTLPSLCAVCRGWGRTRVCGTCRVRFAVARPRCRYCALPLPAGMEACGECTLLPSALDRTVAAVDYGFPWDRLVTALKFNDALDLAGTLAGLLCEAVEREGSSSGVDLIVPVPLSRERLRERGFNQAWELARRAGRRLGITADAKALIRLKDSPHQLSLPRNERADNVRGIFAVEAAHATSLRGRTVAVVDDVMTTGATMRELADVLHRAGAMEVQAWVVARTEPPPTA